jgi:STE24 endopeptidase
MSSRRELRAVCFAILAVIWAAAAWWLWQSKVPGSLHLAHVDTAAAYPPAELRHAQAFSNGSALIWLGTTLTEIVVFALFAWRGAVLTRESAAGPLGTGMLLGMLGFCLLWVATLPFTALEVWWERRYHVANVSYFEAIFGGWLVLGAGFVWLCAALAIVMGLARWLGNWWWLAAAPCFVALLTAFVFSLPYLTPTHKISDPQLQLLVQRLQDKEGVHVPVRIQTVSSDTSLPNAEAEGLLSSRRVVIWDTLLDGRFSNGEIRVVLAHEFGHIKRNHLWKLIGWEALLFFPGAYIISRVTRRRGGMGEPAAVPLSLLVLVVLSLLALPVENAITRHTEAEADWMALQTTRDPKDAEGLFRQFVPTALSDPNPPFWQYVLLENHPTVNQRVGMARAWKALYATSDNQSP